MANSYRLRLWALYDFSTSIVVIVFLVYFSQWFVVENHVPDLWYNLIFVGASLLLVITVPRAAVIADRQNKRMSFLRGTTLLQFFFLLMTACSASYLPPSPSALVLAGSFYFLSVYLHQFALVFYNALLPDISAARSVGVVSGFGQFAKSLGTVAGILISLPFSHGSFRLLGNTGRSQTFLPATLVALLFTLPCLFQGESSRKTEPKISIRWSDYLLLLKQLGQSPGVIVFLVAFFLFNDAILTVQDNLPIYMQRVLMITDKMKSLLIAVGLVAAAIGALLGGQLADKIGLRKTLLCVLSLWIILLPCLSAVSQIPAFSVISAMIGVIFGMTWVVSRALMAHLAPRDQISHTFGYYAIFERFSTLCGPLVWGGIVTSLARQGPMRYRIALLSMVVFIVAGFFFTLRVPADDRHGVATLG